MVYSETAFRGFSDVWTPVAFSRSLGAKPVGLKVAGTGVVLFRDQGGQAAALLDRCPHRGVRLSQGQIRGGCLTCPFHGWRFNGSGECVEVPWHPTTKRDRLEAQPLPTRELGGFIWIYTAVGVTPREEPRVPAELLGPKVQLYGHEVEWGAHWTRAIENMVDDTHLPFVHPRTIGRGLNPTAESVLTLDVEDHPWGCSWRVVIDGRPADWSAELRFPNVTLLRIPVPGRQLGICFAAVPVDDLRVRVLQLGYRDFLRWRAFDPIFAAINRRVLGEDRRVVEASPPGVVPPAQAEVSVATDAVGLRFRKRLYAELLVERPKVSALTVVG